MLKKAITIGYAVCFIALLALGILLVGTMVPFGNYQMRIVLSGSMEPTIPVGATIFISPEASYAVNDVVTFQRTGEEEVTTHRIIGQEVVNGETLFTMQGDANAAPDLRPVREAEIAGAVWGTVPYLGYVIDFARKPAGFALIVLLPAILVIVEQGQKVAAEVRKQKALQQEQMTNTPS